MVKHGLPVTDQTMFTNPRLLIGSVNVQNNRIKQRKVLVGLPVPDREFSIDCLAQTELFQLGRPVEISFVCWYGCRSNVKMTMLIIHRIFRLKRTKWQFDATAHWAWKNGYGYIWGRTPNRFNRLRHLRDLNVAAENFDKTRTGIKMRAHIAKDLGICGLRNTIITKGNAARDSQGFQKLSNGESPLSNILVKHTRLQGYRWSGACCGVPT